ncbi:MAG: hypothetical protein J6T01_01435 [Kiritimatiellae bacterium]|nr:hypothetical protein [Kiritimatiellia bacterium]
MEVDEAFSLISRAIDSGRAAHGYLIVGDLRGSCDELAGRILEKLFPAEAQQARSRCHPDIAVLEPGGAKRIIKVDDMRERMIAPMSLASFSGGWKAGVVVGADRMEAPSANAFLKSLEEPTPMTMYLLLSDQPDGILPTIVSRTQRIDLPMSAGLLEGDDLAEAAAAFEAKDPERLAAKFAELKAAADGADAPLVRKRFYRTLMSFVRETMLGGALPRYLAFANVAAVEDAYRQSQRSIGEEAVLAYMLDRITTP